MKTAAGKPAPTTVAVDRVDKNVHSIDLPVAGAL